MDVTGAGKATTAGHRGAHHLRTVLLGLLAGTWSGLLLGLLRRS